MKTALRKLLLVAAASSIPLGQAYAHTTSVGYENAGPGAVTFWYGTYHTNVNYTEGSFQLEGLNGAYSQTVSFTLLTAVKPTGLIDGQTNFYSDGTALVGTGTTILNWQGVSFANLQAGQYTFTYIPIAQPTSVWQPTDSIILSSSVTLTAADLGTPTAPPAPTIIDGSQGSFSQNDAAATGSVVTFDGGVFAPTQTVSLDKPIELRTNGGVIDTTQAGLTLTNVIQGDGALTKSGDGVLRLTGSNTYTGGTVVQGGVLAGDTISLHGAIQNGAVVAFDQAMDGAFSGAIQGSGQVVKNGNGALTLSGANTYAGGTVLNAGTLVLANEGALGAGALQSNGGTLQLNYGGALPQNVALQQGALTIDVTANPVVASGAITGPGELVKTGSGILNLTGVSALTGATTVEAGRLAVNGSLLGSIATVQDGAEIGGNGRLGGLIVRNRATAAPGNSIGQLSVASFVTFEKGSTYAVEVDAAGRNDRIEVTGQATLEGGTVKVLAASGDYQPTTTYRIISAAGGVVGKFEAVTSNLAFLAPELAYSSNAVDLTLVRNDLTFRSVAATRNQRSVGAAVDAVFPYGGGVYDSLVRGTAGDARAAFDQLSGEAHAGARSVVVADSDLVGRIVAGHLSASGDKPGRAGWGQVFGGWGRQGADDNAAAVKRSAAGLVVGGEATSEDGLTLGFAGAYSQGSSHLAGRNGDIDTTSGHLFGYAAKRVGQVRLRGGVGYGQVDIETDRRVALRTFSDQLKADYDGSMLQGFAEAGYAMQASAVAFEPFVSVSAVRLKTDRFSESGGVAALTGASRTQDLVFGSAGVRAQGRIAASGVYHLTAAVRRTLDGATPKAVLAFGAGAGSFAVASGRLDRTSVALDGGLSWSVTKRLSVEAEYQGLAGRNGQEHTARGGVRFAF